MGIQYSQLETTHQDFIDKQAIFFTATATKTSFINLSPKDNRALKMISPTRVLWLNLTGSGNETQAHLQEDNRMTLMFCSFDKNPLILRLYGQAKSIIQTQPDWQTHLSNFKHLGKDYLLGSRQIFELNIDLVQTSCGFGVPQYDFIGYRDKLIQWSVKKKADGIKEYQQRKNTTSLDGQHIK